MTIHPDLEVLKVPDGLFDVEPCEMDLNVGRRGRFINPNTKVMGSISLESFTIVGVQKDYTGNVCYRVVHDSDTHKFGRVVNPTKTPIKLF